MADREESERTLSIDFFELRIMRMFKPSKTPAAIPNRSAGTFWVRTMGPGMCDCHNSRAILTKAGVKAAVPPRIPPAHHRTRIASDLPPNFVER